MLLCLWCWDYSCLCFRINYINKTKCFSCTYWPQIPPNSRWPWPRYMKLPRANSNPTSIMTVHPQSSSGAKKNYRYYVIIPSLSNKIRKKKNERDKSRGETEDWIAQSIVVKMFIFCVRTKWIRDIDVELKAHLYHAALSSLFLRLNYDFQEVCGCAAGCFLLCKLFLRMTSEDLCDSFAFTSGFRFINTKTGRADCVF